MNKIFNTFSAVLLFACLVSAPVKAQIPHLVFHAELSGSEAIPAVNTNGKALVSFIFSPDRSKVTVSGMLVNLDGAVTEAKIHLGITGETGPEILDLMPVISGRDIVGQLNTPPGLLQNLLLNGVYAEISTSAHPMGEIRGQFVCETDMDYESMLTGGQVIPPTGSNAIAFGGIHFPLGSHDLAYAFIFRGLSSAITEVSIMEGNTVVTYMPNMAAGLIQGIIDLDTINSDFLLKAREGKYDILIKTVNFPQGEIRGKLNHVGFFGSVAPINSVQIPPPAPFSTGFGFSHSNLNGALTQLTTTAFINNLQPTSVKIHIAAPGQVGPELATMDPTAIPGLYTKTYNITEAQLTDFAQGRLYINVTTAAYPNGELRGVMKNTLRKAYAFDLCGAQMVPPTNSNALGIAVASVDQANCYLHYKLITDDLASVPVDGYFAQGAVGINGIAFHAIDNTAPVITGSHEIMAVLGPIIEASGTYLQIGSTDFPNGEIRGQVRRGYSCPEVVVTVTELNNISQVTASPVPLQEVLNIGLESGSAFEGRLVMHDIMGVPALTQTVQIVAGKQTIQIQTNNLPKGIYTLSMEIPGQNTGMLLKKVLKVE